MSRAIALALLIVAGAAHAARWELAEGPGVSVDTTTLGPSPHYPGMTGVWVSYTPSLSVDCSPPRGCYAKTQRIYYTFNCTPRYAVPADRISYDLNGAVVNRELRDGAVPYAANFDAGANAVLDLYCPLPEKDRRR